MADLGAARRRIVDAELLARRGLEAAGGWRHVADRLAYAIRQNGPWSAGVSPGQTAVLDALAEYDRVRAAEREHNASSAPPS